MNEISKRVNHHFAVDFENAIDLLAARTLKIFIFRRNRQMFSVRDIIGGYDCVRMTKLSETVVRANKACWFKS